MTFHTPAPRDPTLPPVRINLLSDTQTRPTAGMSEAIARADVGDEQIGDDPTVNLLCERVADLLGKQTVVSVEQTANIGGGTIWKKADLDEVAKIAKANGLATHMDGARLLNACVATGITARDMASGWDSAWIDFSKGLGAPIGAAIAGSRDFIDEVWRWKQRLGGSMRQAGICAAACVYALDHHVDRLAEDHANARALARGLSQIAGMEVQQPETNLIFFKPDGAGVTGEKMVA